MSASGEGAVLLSDKVVIITGVGPGLGVQLARRAVAEGARVAIAARDAERLGRVADRLRADGGRVVDVATDVGEPEACRALVASTLDAFGRIDGLINSAYAYPAHGPMLDADLDDWRKAFEVTVLGAVQMIQAVVPPMQRQGGGAIVNVGSMVTRKARWGDSGYISTKSALAGATRAAALELGPSKIRVNSVVPGWMMGPPVAGYLDAAARARGVERSVVEAEIVSGIPLGVIPPDEECAKTILLFVSDYTRMVTGASLDVNGGEHMSS